MKQALQILDALRQAGFEAYIVGGAVRDQLMGKKPVDIDICTSAIPEEIKKVAEQYDWNTFEVGAAFGTIVMVVAGKAYEVTTFRREVYGQDSHRPEQVEFSKSLAEDLARRDFTVNALCMTGDGQIIDLFNGQKDLERGILRTVGDAKRRFSEDALRMFRAARFVAKLDFILAPDMDSAIRESLERVRGLSVERVRDELESILIAPFATKGLNLLMTTGLFGETCKDKEAGDEYAVAILPELMPLNGLEQNPRHHKLDVWHHTLSVVEQVPAKPVLRWAALLHDVGKGRPGVRGLNQRGEIADHGHEIAGTELAAGILKRLKMDKDLTRKVTWLVRHHMNLLVPEDRLVKRWLKKRSADFKDFREFKEAIHHWCVLAMADRIAKHMPVADILTPIETKIKELLEQIPFYPAQLAVSGGDIAKLLGSGPQVAKMQHTLLERVQNRQLKNNREELLIAVQRRCQRQAKGV